MENQTAIPKAKIMYDVNSANFQDGPAFREITLRVNVRDTEDCARAVSLLCNKLAVHLDDHLHYGK